MNESEVEHLFTIREQEVQQNGSYIDNEIQDVFLIKKDLNLADLTLQEEEVSEVAWMPVEKLYELATEGDKNFAPHPEQHKKLFELLQK